MQMGTPSATIDLVYKVPTTSLLLYYQTHFVLLHCWYNAMVVAHGAGLSFEQRCVLLTSLIYLFICFFSFETKNNFTNRNSIKNICNSSCIPFMLSNKRVFSKYCSRFLIIFFFCLLGCIWLCNWHLRIGNLNLK